MKDYLVWAAIAIALPACKPARPPTNRPNERPAQLEWRDPSPHSMRLVAVDHQVSLEVLDWGGTGEPVVFLAGSGNTAHVYDDFAPRFTDRFRVIAITRRGFGASSQPGSGYDIGTRVSDLLAVLDTLGLLKVNLVGHSLAGDEVTGFAARHPTRVQRLVYLDAAYDHRTTPRVGPPFPPMTAADSASPAALHAFASDLGQPLPEADLRANVVLSPTGRIERDVTPGWVFKALLGGVEQPPYTRVAAPALAFYSQWESVQAVLSPGWWRRLTDAQRDQASTAVAQMAAWSKQERSRFRQEMRHGQVVELLGANHHVWLTNEEQVLRKMRAFLGGE